MSIPPKLKIANVQLNFAKKNQFCMNEIHFRRSESQFHTKNLFLIWQKSFSFWQNSVSYWRQFFHESEIEIRSRDLDFHLGKVQFHFSEIDMEKV